MGSIATSALNFIACESANFDYFLYSNTDFDITFENSMVQNSVRHQNIKNFLRFPHLALILFPQITCKIVSNKLPKLRHNVFQLNNFTSSHILCYMVHCVRESKCWRIIISPHISTDAVSRTIAQPASLDIASVVFD